MILLDTSVVSAVLRRRSPAPGQVALAQRVQALLNGGQRIGVPAIVLQEVLAGIREPSQFEAIKGVLLRGYPVVTATVGDHVLAADITNRCRRKGTTVAAVDALIAAITMNARAELFAVDEDFRQMAKQVPLRLVEA